MRLLYSVQRYGPEIIGGSEAACRSFAEQLAARGHQVEVVTSCARAYTDWANEYEPGRAQVSYDKQYVRDWLDESGWDHEPPSPPLPDEVVERTAEKYLEACRALTDSVPEG